MLKSQRLVVALFAVAILAVVPAFAAGPSTGTRAPAGTIPAAPSGQGCQTFLCTGTTEVEANCGITGGVGDDTVDGGCNSTPPVFWPIALGETICGSAEWNGTFRDTDWYEINLTDALTDVTFTVDAEFPALIGVLDGNNGCPVNAFLRSTFTAGCGDVQSVNVQLGSGTWWFFVAPDFGGPTFACGDRLTSLYSATLTGTNIPVLQAIPTLSYVGFAVLAVLLAGVGFWFLKQRKSAPTA
ncbi:MAG: hypothetical protein U0X73_00815 [Thermoanaerobaculia bacterium]